jgi:hypothetical protein
MNQLKKYMILAATASSLGGAPMLAQNAVVPSPHYSPISAPSVLIPRHGTVSTEAATRWQDSLVVGNGIMGALLAGDPEKETLILTHAKMWLPLGSREILPTYNNTLAEMRRRIKTNGYQSAQSWFLDEIKKGGWGGNIVWTDPIHPAAYLSIDQPLHETAQDYARVENFETGEASVQWKTSEGHFSRRLFVSQPDNVVVLNLDGPKGKVNANFSAPPPGDNRIINSTTSDNGWIREHNVYLNGKGGYDIAIKVINHGGSEASRTTGIGIENADGVTLIMRVQPWKTPLENTQASEYMKDCPDFHRTDQTAGPYRAAMEYQPSWMTDLQVAIDHVAPSYDALLKRQIAVWKPMFDRVTIDLNASEKQRKMSSEELLTFAQKNRTLPPALLERMYDAGRYIFMSSAGSYTPPNLFGIWTGDFKAAWSGDYTTDTNLQLDVECAFSGNMAEKMNGFFDFWIVWFPIFRRTRKRCMAVGEFS